MKIMFICTGNICRSAMAEGMLKKLLEERGIRTAEVYSCGTYAETGDCATYNAIEAAKLYGADISMHRATNIRDSRISDMDVILCASLSHKQSVENLYPYQKGKVYTIKEYANLDRGGRDKDIKDPWGCDMLVYQKCAKEIKECLDRIILKIR